MAEEKLKYIIRTPWDSRVFGINTYEIKVFSEEAMKEAMKLEGHFTIKVDPFCSKALLHKYGFYYCDTLVEPYCAVGQFAHHGHDKAGISTSVAVEDLIAISHGAFRGRFHRDFNISKSLADLRYDMWLRDLHRAGGVFGLMFDDGLAGFFAFTEERIRLHAMSKKYSGRGLAKYLWSAACRELFSRGYEEISSSVSASNNPILSLYRSLGFRFRNSVDAYHRLVG